MNCASARVALASSWLLIGNDVLLADTPVAILHSFGARQRRGISRRWSSRIRFNALWHHRNRRAFGNGIVYSFDTANSQFAVVHSFGSIPNDGRSPRSGLTLVGNTLYGATSSGGTVPTAGTIYSLSTDGSNYQVVHNFLGGFVDGGRPEADLTLVGDTLYGTSLAGGASGSGTVFAPDCARTCRLVPDFDGLRSVVDGSRGIQIESPTRDRLMKRYELVTCCAFGSGFPAGPS